MNELMPDAPIKEDFEVANISIPGDVVGSGKQQVRMASFLFRNVSGLLPENLNGTASDDDRLVFLSYVKLHLHA